MEMYNVKILGICHEIPRKAIGDANGAQVPEGKEYFERMGKGEIILDAPLFDHFFLQSHGYEEDWEWKLQDVHGFIGVGSIIVGWYISDKFKQVLEKLVIAKEYHFYHTKLLYKGNKLDYWIFQFAGLYGALNKSSYIDFSRSVFFDESQGALIPIKDHEGYKIQRSAIRKKSNFEKELKFSKMVLTAYVDFLPLASIYSGVIVSSAFKKVIEEAGIDGLEFSSLYYEVES